MKSESNAEKVIHDFRRHTCSGQASHPDKLGLLMSYNIRMKRFVLYWKDYAVALLLAHWFGKPRMQKVRLTLFITDNS
jgi:hypothetical protein